MAEILESWMIRNLDRYGNCVLPVKHFRKNGTRKIVEAVKDLGYKDAYIIKNYYYTETAPHQKNKSKTIQHTVYIVETNLERVEQSYYEEEPMKFELGDYVEVTKGLHVGSKGEIVDTTINDEGTDTYEIYVHELYDKIGTIVKKGEELMKTKRKPGKPKKMKILTAAPQQSSIDDQAKSIDDQAKSIDDQKPTEELVELSKEIADAEEAAEPECEKARSAYDMLLDCYDTLRKQMNVPELLTFFDIVKKDVDDSKMVLDQMYQMTIEQLMQIRKGLAS